MTRFTLNIPGFVALRNSPEVVNDLERRARAIASADKVIEMGETRTRGGRSGRASVTVYTLPRDRDALMRALDRGRR